MKKIVVDVRNTVPVYCMNNDAHVQVPCGVKLLDLVDISGVEQDKEAPFLGALVNNKVRDMSFRITKPAQVHFFTYSCCSIRWINSFPRR